MLLLLAVNGLPGGKEGPAGPSFRHRSPSPTPTSEGETELSLVDFGYPSTLQLTGNLAETVLTLPVPLGWQPQALEGELEVSPFLERGLLFVEQQDRLLATVSLPAERERLRIDLQQAEVRQGLLVLRLRTVLDPDDPECAAPLTRWVTLKALRVRFSGQARPPRTLAEFWPPDLQLLVLQVPAKLSPPLSTAALRLVAHATLQARGHPLRVRLLPLGEPVSAPLGPFVRVVRLKTGIPAQLYLEPVTPHSLWPALVLQAPEGEMPALVDRVVAQWMTAFPLAQITIEQAWQPTPSPVLSLPLTELSYQQLRMQGAGVLESRIVFRQADFGTPISQVALTLQGYTTPLPPGGAATFTLLFNGGLVYAQPLDGGDLNVRVELPSSLLRRENTLSLRVLYTPPGGQCRVGVHDIIVDVNPRTSRLEAVVGQFLPPGFTRFPQALMPEFRVALDPMSLASLQRAARILMALQRLSPYRALQPRVLPWQEALEEGAPLVAVTTPERAVALRPPVEPVPFRLVDYQGQELLRVRPDSPFALLQAFEHRGRDVLLLTYWQQPETMDTLLAALETLDGWYRLTGDVWLLADLETPVAFRVQDSGLQVQTLEETGWRIPRAWKPWLALAALLLLGGLLAWSYPRLVRQPPIDEV